MLARHSLRSCQYCWTFIAPLPTQNNIELLRICQRHVLINLLVKLFLSFQHQLDFCFVSWPYFAKKHIHTYYIKPFKKLITPHFRVLENWYCGLWRPLQRVSWGHWPDDRQPYTASQRDGTPLLFPPHPSSIKEMYRWPNITVSYN